MRKRVRTIYGSDARKHPLQRAYQRDVVWSQGVDWRWRLFWAAVFAAGLGMALVGAL